MKIKELISDTRQELTKVTWPDRKKVISLVMVIFVILFLVSAYVFIIDNLLSYIIKFIEGIRL